MPTASPPTRALVTMPDLCAFLHTTEPTVYRMIQRGRLPHYKVGRTLRFDLDEVRDFLRRGPVERFEHPTEPKPRPTSRPRRSTSSTGPATTVAGLRAQAAGGDPR